MRRCGAFSTLLLVLAAAASGPRPAGAGSDTGQLSVSAVVLSSCSVIGGSLDFGQYVSGQPTDLDVVGQIDYANCSGTLSFALDGGLGGDINAREMRSGDARLRYQLYRTPSRLAVWGEGLDAYETTVLQTQGGKINVFGRVFRGQAVPDGTYADVVNITLTF